MTEIEELQQAKRKLAERYARRAWFRGVGIAPTGDGYCLRLNVDPRVDVKQDEIPRRFGGYAVEVVLIEGYEPRNRQG